MTKGVKIIFTDEQIAWVVENFADTMNADICEYLQCGETTLRLLARSLGLEKSREFYDRRSEKAKKNLRRYFLTHPPTDNSKNLMPFCFKKGNDPRELKGFWSGMEKMKETRRRIIREEKARIAFGLEQRTRLQLKKQPRAKVYVRHYLKKKGYIIDDEKHIAYYTDETVRAFKIESRPKRFYSFEPITKEIL